jgi:hypothetical protein
LNFKEDPKNRFYSIDWKKIQLFFLGTLIPLLFSHETQFAIPCPLKWNAICDFEKENESPNPSCPKLSIN